MKIVHRRASQILAATLGAAALLGGGLFLMTAHAQDTAAAPKALPKPVGKITPWAAMKIALGKVQGEAINANYEYDEGHWVYGVMVVTPKGLQEVEIDPTSGKVGDVEAITPEGEAKETAQELNAALKRNGVTVSAPVEKGEADEKGEKDEKPGTGGR